MCFGSNPAWLRFKSPSPHNRQRNTKSDATAPEVKVQSPSAHHRQRNQCYRAESHGKHVSIRLCPSSAEELVRCCWNLPTVEFQSASAHHRQRNKYRTIDKQFSQVSIRLCPSSAEERR